MNQNDYCPEIERGCPSRPEEKPYCIKNYKDCLVFKVIQEEKKRDCWDERQLGIGSKM